MFSQKYGYTTAKAIQHERISDTLRQRVWNLFYLYEIQAGGLGSPRINNALSGKPTIEALISDKLGFPASATSSVIKRLETYIIKECEWYRVYDFIDIHLSLLQEEKRAFRAKQYNDLLEEEKSGYRVVNGSIEPITDKKEIESIEQASTTAFSSVNEHMKKALEHYGDLRNPDYENSIKESISAVEAMCCIITGKKKATLGDAIKALKDKGIHIHSAMIEAFSKLYGYASDEPGIRHGSIDFTNAPAEDAKFMLVSCSAFVNYLIEKWSKVATEQRVENE